MKLETITPEAAIAALEGLTEDHFADVELAVLEALYSWPYGRIVHVTWNGEALGVFTLDKSSYQPLPAGHCYVASWGAGWDILDTFAEVLETDAETGERYMPAQDGDPRVNEGGLLAWYLTYGELIEDLERLRNDFADKVAANIRERVYDAHL